MEPVITCHQSNTSADIFRGERVSRKLGAIQFHKIYANFLGLMNKAG